MSPNNIHPDHEQLSLLASQHHKSEYNRSKFGDHGSPLRYLPLSLQLPEKYSQLRRKQLSAPQAYSWSRAAHTAQATSEPSASIQDELMDAMSEPLVLSQPIQVSIPVRTSQTHPINVSSIIPPKYMGLISSHAIPATSHSPTLLDLPPSFFLYRLGIERDSRKSHPQPHTPQIALPSIPNYFRTQSNMNMGTALQLAMSSSMDSVRSTESIDDVSGFAQHTTLSVAVSISSDQDRPSGSETQVPDLMNDASLAASHFEVHLQETRPDPALRASGLPMMIPPSSVYHRMERSATTLGNLLLSSCPGKKVRLDGPVKGRTAVCRDLECDIRRIKDLNVGCIICCLDDEELEFLGSPWSEYSDLTQKYGIDVLRVPIPEGLPPISTGLLDKHLADVISRYTLNGVSVLVHCRGGVGRAGVIACCWMIRLGLCGWPIPDSDDASLAPFPATTPTAEWSDSQGKQARVAFVERVIATIRKRRSMKAIETYEQVKFLLEYVEFLERRYNSPPPPDISLSTQPTP